MPGRPFVLTGRCAAEPANRIPEEWLIPVLPPPTLALLGLVVQIRVELCGYELRSGI
jgi:hypothetical protein